MSYGMFDGDLVLYPRVPFFNLELMKLSTYYKSKREIVSLAPSFVPQRYTHFLLRQDYFGQQTYPLHFSNIEYGGRAFDGGVYKPLPVEVEICKPDIDLYNSIKPNFRYSTVDVGQLQVMRNAAHIRLSLDGKTVWKDFKRQIPSKNFKSGFIFHDYDLGQIEGARETIQSILDTYTSNKVYQRIGMKFPTQVNTEDELIKWLQFSNMQSYFSLQFNGIPNISYVEEIAENLTKTKNIQATMNVTYNTTYNKFITQDIVQILPFISSLRSHNSGMALIYDEHFFVNKRWVEVMDLLQQYCAHIANKINETDYRERIARFETFYSYVARRVKYFKRADILPKEKAQRIFQFVREQNYDLFVQFYECC